VTARLSHDQVRQPHWTDFLKRLDAHFPRLFALYLQIYPGRYDLIHHLENLTLILAENWLARPGELRGLDSQRERAPRWFQSHQQVGAVCYVDLFAGDLAGVRAKIPYFKELGITYLHLMPLFRQPEGGSDGGYAVSSYREVHAPLGTMDDLVRLAQALRAEGISLVLDLVFNHTSSQHPWALAARSGSPDDEEIYRLFPDRELPDQYERTLREVFPEEHAGAFSFDAGLGKWVWTTFHAYQWDLNYANPEVFNRMAGEMLFLANAGAAIIRLDAVAFIWKELGTSCENLPQAHLLIQAFNAAARIAAPSLLFKSEAIVHPDQVAEYISPQECQLSYNPLLMALLWEALATRQVNLLHASLAGRFAISPDCAWVNYVRVHDDIGWTFADEDAWRLWINAFHHRQFLNRFYSGQFEGSFARGLPFQHNPATGDMRISGTCASLAGLEKALQEETAAEVELALRRILLLHSLILSVGGIPLIYLGDEIGACNDYTYAADPAKAGDSRWVHRPRADEAAYARRHDPETVEGRLFQRLCRLIQLRKTHPVFSGGDTEFIPAGNPHVLAYVRQFEGARLLALASFSEQRQIIPRANFAAYLRGKPKDLVTGKRLPAGDTVALDPYQLMWIPLPHH
jgi:glycosidase